MWCGIYSEFLTTDNVEVLVIYMYTSSLWAYERQQLQFIIPKLI